jgi:pyrroline-5-carboxylate reductase
MPDPLFHRAGQRISREINSFGFIGVGTLATAIIRGLRHRRPLLSIHLSPRSQATSLALSCSDERIYRHSSNAEVVDASQVVFLTMRPPQLATAVSGLRFRADQVVLSCLSGVTLAELKGLCEPAGIYRLQCIPSIAWGEGPLVLVPSNAQVLDFLGGLGTLIAVEDETVFGALWAGSTVMSTISRLQKALIDWKIAHGVPPHQATAYVHSLLHAVAKISARAEESTLTGLPQAHETPGGLNYRVRLWLEERGWFDMLGFALTATSQLKGESLTVLGDDQHRDFPTEA